MAGNQKVTDTDRGYKALAARIKKAAKGKTVAVGILIGKEENRDDGLTNVLVGSVHEFGAPSQRIPERSFIRATVDDNRRAYEGLLRKHAKAVADGKLTADVALGRIGAKITADVQQKIADKIPPPLSAVTLAMREARGTPSTTPLIDTGQLRRSVTWDVRKP